MRFSDSQRSYNYVLPYILATALVVGFGALQWYLIQAFGLQMIYLMFFPPIMISAWFAGWRGGMFTTLLSTLFADYFFLKPLYQFWPIEGTQFWTSFIFIVEGFFISALGEMRLKSRQALLRERNTLEQRVIERTREISDANELLANQIAERERAQAALIESESKFRSIIETASDAIVISNAEGTIIFWNHGAQAMFGYSPEEALQKPVTLLIPAALQEAHTSAMERLRGGAAPRLMGQPLELRGCRRDGSEFPLELSLATWQEGEQKFYSGIMRDLTPRYQAEENRVQLIEEMAAHAESQVTEQRYRLLAEAIPQIVWTTTGDGAADYFNQHWFEYTGLTPEQSVGWAWEQVLHPDDRLRSLEKWKQAIASGQDFEIEYRLRRHDGAYRWHLGRAVPLRGESGRVAKWFGTCTDIDTQKSTEEASRFEAQAMSQLTASLDEVAIAQTLARLCASALATACAVDLIETSGFSQEALTAPPESRPIPILRRAAFADEDIAEHIENRGQAGHASHGLFYAAPPTTPSSGPWQALTMRRVQKLTGAEMKPLIAPGAIWEAWRDAVLDGTLGATLCVPILARGRALGVLTLFYTNSGQRDDANAGMIQNLASNAALMIDNARLLRQMQETNKAKDEFLAVLSHELRTPLTAILGWVQLLQSPSLDDQTRQRAFQTIERNTHAQVQLIEDLLDLSRIVTGKLSLETGPVHIKPLIEAALDAIRPVAQAKEITLSFLPIGLPTEGNLVMDDLVLGDEHRLQQVFWNLLSNAVKFTPKGGRVEVELRRIESQIEVSVRDNGQGIGQDFLPYVFERFRQADSSSTRQHGGLGLGLAIVRHVVDLHGGSVQVESKGENQGATFKVLLPPMLRRESFSNESRTAPGNGIHPTGDATMLKGVRVLLVDDERDTRDMLSAVLRRYGADVQACSSALEALELLPQWQPRVLVSDIGMPGQDGYDLIRSVRALTPAQGRDVPAMALTAYARQEDRDLALIAGYHRHVVKPVDPAALATQVAELANGVAEN